MRIMVLLFMMMVVIKPAFGADAAAAPVNRTIEKEMLAEPLSSGPSYWTRLEKIAYLKGQLSKLQPVRVTYGALGGDREKQLVKHLIEAGKCMDQLFFIQAYGGNAEILRKLEKSSDPLDALTLRYFLFNVGPFDRLNDYAVFYGTEKKPLGANFYASDITKTELEQWIKDHPEDRKAFTGEFTVIKRSGNKLVAVPYHAEYAALVKESVDHLRKAAQFADNDSLRRYILSRADALLTDDYYRSDVDWMTIEGSDIELIIGPYEVYEDRLMNYKASYEAFIYKNLAEDAKEFESYVKHLPELENNLPIPDADKNMDRDFTSPIRIVDLIYSAGDARAGVHTAAFALPNDERVRKEKGSKKVMLKNIMAAKFNASTYPIGQIVLNPDQVQYLSFDSYFRDVVFHELSHGIGPGELKMPDGTKMDVRTALKENYSAIEECKADTLSIYSQLYLMDKNILPKDDFRKMCTSYMTGLFRSVRFGVEEAHGKGALIQMNWMTEKGALSYDEKSGTYTIQYDKVAEANRGLSQALLDIQRKGDYEGSNRFMEKYGRIPSHLNKTFEKLYDVPIDILPEFVEPR